MSNNDTTRVHEETVSVTNAIFFLAISFHCGGFVHDTRIPITGKRLSEHNIRTKSAQEEKLKGSLAFMVVRSKTPAKWLQSRFDDDEYQKHQDRENSD